MTDYSSKDSDRNEDNKLPKPIGAIDEYYLLRPVYREGAFEDLRLPSVSSSLLAQIILDPRAFGADKIRQALEYMKNEIVERSGSVKRQAVEFEEQLPNKPYNFIYEFGFIALAADEQVVVGAWLNVKAARLKDAVVVDQELLGQLRKDLSSEPQHLATVERMGSVYQSHGLTQEDTETILKANEPEIILRISAQASIVFDTKLLIEHQIRIARYGGFFDSFGYYRAHALAVTSGKLVHQEQEGKKVIAPLAVDELNIPTMNDKREDSLVNIRILHENGLCAECQLKNIGSGAIEIRLQKVQ